MNRPSIADLARAADVSVSTVDRVLNGRLPVRQATAERVLASAERIGFRSATAIRHRLTERRPERTFGFVLQQRSSRFYRALGDGLAEAVREARASRGIATVALDQSEDSLHSLMDGTVKLMLAPPLRALAEAAVKAMIAASGGGMAGGVEDILLPVVIQTAESV